MSGYLPPHTHEGPASKLYQPSYPVNPPSSDGPETEHPVFLPANTVPTRRTLITLDATPPKPAAGFTPPSSSASTDPSTPVTVRLPVMGFGLWAWGDVLTYGWAPSGGYDLNLNEQSVDGAFSKMLELFPSKLLLDTAEHYGYTDGQAEKQLGRVYGQHGGAEGNKELRDHLVLATKFLPTPWRHPWRYPHIVLESLGGSLTRTRFGHVDLYQLHGPSHFGFWPRLSTICQGLADAYHTGKIKAVGTCNLSLEQVTYVRNELAKRGVPLVSNQVEFSLVRMDPLTTGLIEGCRKMGIATIAYSPLAVGRLSGKYSEQQRPRGNRNFGDVSWNKIQPIVDELRAIGKERSVTPTAVALNWVICHGAIPIPTAKNAQQVEDCASALGWKLTAEQVERLDKVGLTNQWDWNMFKHVQNWVWQKG